MQEPPLHSKLEERVRRLEGQVNRLRQDYRIGETEFGPLPEAASVMGVRHAGSNYYISNTLNTRPTFTTGLYSANWLLAVPFYVPNVGGIADRIAMEVTTGSAGNARLGIYDSGRDLYPSRLLLDAGVVSTASTGVKAITIRQGLTRGVKWLVIVPSGSPHVRVIDTTGPGVWCPLGVDPSTWAYYANWAVAFNYAALPAKFPASASKSSGAPVLMLRFAV